MVKQAKVLPSHIKQAKHDEIDEKKNGFHGAMHQAMKYNDPER